MLPSDDGPFGTQHIRKRNRAPAHPGSPEFHEARKALPAGPQSLQELFQWQSQFVMDVLAPVHQGFEARERCLKANVGGGAIIYSDHSGTGNGERAALEVMAALGPSFCSPSSLHIYSCIDPSAAAQVVLSSSYKGCQAILASDISESIPQHMQDMMGRLRPQIGQDAGERSTQFEKMYKWMVSNLDDRLPDDRCIFDVKSQEHRPAFVQRIVGTPHSMPIILWVSGTECFAFSAMGRLQRTSHDNFETFLVWVCTIKKSRPHIVIHEITELHPESILEFVLSDECPSCFRR